MAGAHNPSDRVEDPWSSPVISLAESASPRLSEQSLQKIAKNSVGSKWRQRTLASNVYTGARGTHTHTHTEKRKKKRLTEGNRT